MKGKKLLASVLSAAMVLGTMALPVFADDATMTFDDFVAKIEAGESIGTDDGRITVEWSPVSGCGLNNGNSDHADGCPLGLERYSATASTPAKVNSSLAQFQFGKAAGDITIKNVDFKYVAADFTFCHNERGGSETGRKTIADAPTAQLHLYNTGNVTVTGCTFDNVVLTPWKLKDNGVDDNRVVDIEGCTFKNISNSYGIKDIQASYVKIVGNTFENTRSGIMLSGGDKDSNAKVVAKNVLIDNNTFNCDASKNGDLIQIAKTFGFDNESSVAIVNNTSTSDTAVLRALNDEMTNLIYANNIIPETAPLLKDDASPTMKDAINDKLVTPVAKNGDTYYKTLADAVASAAFGDTVQLLCDTTGTGIRVDSGKNITIDFGGYKYIMNNPLVGSSKDYETNGFQLLQNSEIIMKNGTLYSDVANILIQNYANLTLEDMNLFLNRVHERPNQPLYTLSNNNGHIVLTGNTNISALDRNFAFDVCRYADYPGVSVTLDENMTGTINGRIELSGTKKADNDFELIIKNGTVNGPIVNSAPTANIQISGGSFTTDVSAYCADGFAAKKIGDVWVVDESASKVSLGFKATGDARVYDIVVKAEDANEINRLNTADLTFNLTASDAANSSVVYTILPVDDITVTPDMENVNRYMFNFNGKDGITADTGAEVKIGQVQFDGYTTNGAKITFTADADKSLVTATTKSNNLVTYFGNGAFANATEADRKIDGVEFAVPTKTLTVNIAMNNKVTDNVKTYQDMKVEIKGANVSKTIDLGTDGTAQTANGVYTLTEELEQNIPYTVTVSGAGYRTARYTVNLNADKTLNFWNNVMDEAKVVEVNNEAYKKNVTFLAGDIVKDNKINIYDLSAVVSYFGTDNLVTAHPEYAKYDLNRDGVIDSKDVAYVLVSWGN